MLSAVNKHLRTREKAYFTVEAALILPMVLLFTAVMIFMAFYSYDRCILEQSAYEAALRGTGSCIEDAQEAYEEAHMAAGRLTDERLFACRDFGCDVSVTADSVIVTYHCSINMPFLGWLEEFSDDLDFSINVSREAGRFKTSQEIRFFRTINGKGPIKNES